jgi:hypothetical protein
MGDGKGLARGQLPGGKGDVDLFGHEEGPTKQQLQRFIDNMQGTVDAVRDDLSLDSVRTLLDDCTSLLSQLTLRSLYFQKRREGMVKRFQKENNEKAFSAGMSWVNAMDYKTRSAIEKFLEMNDEILSVLAHLQGNHDSFMAGDSLFVDEISNLKLLKKPMELENDYALESVATHLVKPGTDLWSKLRHEAYVTGDTMFCAIGLKTQDAMKKHDRNFIRKAGNEDFIPEETLKPPPLQYLSFLASKLASALYSNATIEQVGVIFQDSRKCARFMAVTPDCILKEGGRKRIPVLFEEKEVESMPSLEYICRALCEMHILGANYALHVTILPGYILAHKVQMDTTLAQEVIEIAAGIYDKDNLEDVTMPPKLILTWKQDILSKLSELSANNCTECVRMRFSPHERFDHSETSEAPETIPGPYMPREQKTIHEINCSFLDCTMKYILDICDNSLVDAHTLLRPQADEIFAIMATDTDRVTKPNIPAQVPVAYGLKGGGLSTSTLRSIMDEVKDEMQSRNLNVCCEVFDGYVFSIMYLVSCFHFSFLVFYFCLLTGIIEQESVWRAHC